MGNFITTLVSTTSPFITKNIIIPTILHPHVLGGVPFNKPSTLLYFTLYILGNFLIIGSTSILSGMMTTMQKCRKYSFLNSVKNSRWVLFFTLLGIIFINIFSFTKSPVLAFISWMPYANDIVTGLYLALFVMLGGILANTSNRNEVC